MGLFDKKITNVTNVDQDVYDYYTPVGTDGYGNRSVGAGGTDRSRNTGAPIAGDGNFAPAFSFAPTSQPSSGYSLDSIRKGLAANPTTYNDLAAMLRNGGDGRSVEQWLLEDLQGGDTNSEFLAIAAGGGGVGRDAAPAPSSNQFGGAVQGSGTVAGVISGPVASGDGSQAFQVGGGGVAAGGNINNSQIVTAPITGPFIGGDADGPVITVTAPVGGPIIGGDAGGPIVSANTGSGISAPITNGDGDQQFNAPVIIGNSGSITFTSSDADVAQAAIAAANAGADQSLSFARDALAAVGESRRDPGEVVTTKALDSMKWALLGLAALAVLNS